MGIFDDSLTRRARDLDQDGDPDTGVEYVLWTIGAIALTAFVFGFSFWMSSFLAGFDRLPGAAFVNLPKGIVGAFGSPADVGAGWAEYKPLIGPWWLFWPVLGITATYTVQTVRRIRRWYIKWRYPENEGARWALDEDLEAEKNIIDPKITWWHKLTGRQATNADGKPPAGVVFGAKDDSGRLVRLQPDNHALVVAGTRSGKTAGLMTPALLTYDGAVIATSVKDDLVKDTITERRKRGRVWIFDPARTLPIRTGDPVLDKKNGACADEKDIAFWSPLDNCRDWREAMRTADVLIETTMGTDSDGNMAFFKSMSQKVLPVLLYAAAVMDEDMRRVLRWLNRINEETTHAEVDSVLRWKEQIDALDIWLGFLGRDTKLRGDIGATIETTVQVYQDPRVQDTAMTQQAPPGRHINTTDFIDGKQNTLYVVAPVSEQSRLEPIFVALMQGILTDIADLPYNLDTPLLVALDEAANIAGMPKLPIFLSTIGSKHVSIITAWQDFSQIQAKYKDLKNTVIGNSRGKMILPGVADPETLEYFSKIGGQELAVQLNLSRAERDGQQRQISASHREKPLLDIKTLREQKFGYGILVYGNMPAVRIKLKMFFEDPELIRRSGGTPAPWPVRVVAKLPVIRTFVKLGKKVMKS